MQPLNVIITDDHNLFRAGIRSMISDFSFVGEIYEAGNGNELLELLGKLNPLPDVVLLDLKMPGMDGMEATIKIKELYPGLKIIILTMEDDEQIILHMINEGVNGYLMKNADSDELEMALKMLVTNDFYFPKDISNVVLRSLHSKDKAGLKQKHELTEREVQVLELICKELTANEIAEQLSLSTRTVEGHKRHLLEKTRTKNMAGLVIYALKNKIVMV